MNLLFFIGTLGALFLLLNWSRIKTSPPRQTRIRKPASESNPLVDFNHPTPDAVFPSVRKLSQEEERWFIDHTDPVFGRPTGYEPPPGWQDCAATTISNEYFVLFLENAKGSIPVSTDEFPLVEQKKIFAWLRANIDSITDSVPRLLLQPFEQNPEDGEAFFGPPAEENAKRAFIPQFITEIILKGSHPVSWSIRFDHATEQDVYGLIEGRDELAYSAKLFM